MEIPQEVIENRVLIVKPDTDLELIMSVDHYNHRMAQARKQMRGILLLERIFFLLNVTLLVAIGVIGIKTGGVFILEPRIEWLETASLVAFVAGFVWFGMIKRNFIMTALFSVLLIFMDLRCAILIGVNAVLVIFHELKLSKLKNRQGFPLFRNIHIEKEIKKEDIIPPAVPEQVLEEKNEIPLDKSEEK